MTANTTAAAPAVFTASSAAILHGAYDSIFDLCQLAATWRTYDGVEIDYASFDRQDTPLTEEAEIIATVTAGGSEGVYIDVAARTYDREAGAYRFTPLGTIKTLQERRAAHKAMGALAGELSYLANRDLWHSYCAWTRQQDKRPA